MHELRTVEFSSFSVKFLVVQCFDKQAIFPSKNTRPKENEMHLIKTKKFPSSNTFFVTGFAKDK